MEMNSGSNWVPYLHFTAGDNLYFKTLHPSSTGAITAACFILACLAVVERYLVVVRCSLEARWSESNALSDAAAKNSRNSLDISRSIPHRVVPRFITTHDIPRGLIHAVQVFLRYALMLAVMTFQAAYIISIIVGAGLGEAIFGRFYAGRA